MKTITTAAGKDLVSVATKILELDKLVKGLGKDEMLGFAEFCPKAVKRFGDRIQAHGHGSESDGEPVVVTYDLGARDSDPAYFYLDATAKDMVFNAIDGFKQPDVKELRLPPYKDAKEAYDEIWAYIVVNSYKLSQSK